MINVNGYSVKTLAEILDEQKSNFETKIGAYVALLPEEILGQIRDIYAKGLKDLEDLGNALYNSYGLTASGVALDKVANMLGKSRRQATYARIRDYKIVLTGAGTITVPAGTTFRSITDSTIEFELAEEYSNVAGTYRVDVIASNAGLTAIVTNDISEIATPVSGLSSGTNDGTSKIINGLDLETDDELRFRLFNVPVIARTLRSEAIENAILDVNDNADSEGYTPVSQVKLITNEASVTVNGMLPNTIQPVVYYPGTADALTDSAVCEAIALSKPDGIRTVSTTTNSYAETVTVGNSQRSVTFSRPDTANIYVVVNTSPALSVSNKTALKNAIKAFGDEFLIGQDVIVYGKNSISQIINDFEDAEITDYEIFIGTSPAPSGTANISIDDTEIALFDTSRITVGDL